MKAFFTAAALVSTLSLVTPSAASALRCGATAPPTTDLEVFIINDMTTNAQTWNTIESLAQAAELLDEYYQTQETHSLHMGLGLAHKLNVSPCYKGVRYIGYNAPIAITALRAVDGSAAGWDTELVSTSLHAVVHMRTYQYWHLTDKTRRIILLNIGHVPNREGTKFIRYLGVDGMEASFCGGTGFVGYPPPGEQVAEALASIRTGLLVLDDTPEKETADAAGAWNAYFDRLEIADASVYHGDHSANQAEAFCTEMVKMIPSDWYVEKPTYTKKQLQECLEKVSKCSTDSGVMQSQLEECLAEIA